MIQIRKAGLLHTREMAEILSEIVEIGGTTAATETVTAQQVADKMADHGERSAWHVAEDQTGRVMGYQWIAPADYLPREAAEIATFARVGHTGLGIGSKLFVATQAAAKQLGYEWINANIRADNEGGLIYYQSRGFEDYGRIDGYELANGQIVDKILKRFNLA